MCQYNFIDVWPICLPRMLTAAAMFEKYSENKKKSTIAVTIYGNFTNKS